MNFKNSVITIIVLILIKEGHFSAECNSCAALTQIACVSETQYQNCVNNIPSGPINSCPTDYVCSTATSTICQPRGSYFPTCDGCYKCDSSLTFACTGPNTYSLCLGTNIPTIAGSCGTNMVCNIKNPQICDNESTPTCFSSVTSTTAVTPTVTTSTTAPNSQHGCQIFWNSFSNLQVRSP